MCGIVGYIGKKPVLPILISSLKRLEYRGYDSFGFFTLNSSEDFLLKKVGKISEWEDKLSNISFDGSVGIGHTRWATTGEVNEANAHPHCDCKGDIFLVHNGIIENYRELKDNLIKEGHKFTSDTDTEVFCHLIEKYFKGNLEEAVRESLKGVKGNYGIAVISKKDPQKIVLARFGAPLLIGVSDGEYFIASDPAAMVSYTRKVITLDDNEVAVISPDNHLILKEKPIEKIDWEIQEAEKKGFSHFMLKEIFEEPNVIKESIRGRMDPDMGLARLGGLEQESDRLNKVRKMILVGCGTARYAAMTGECMLEEYAKIPTKVEVASEFRYRKPILGERTAILAISQSGETADTLEAVKEAKRKGSLSLGLVNAVGSSIARETDAGVYNRAGLEIGVAATKSFVSQLAILALLSVSLGRKREMSLVTGKRILEELQKLPSLSRKIIEQADYIKELAQKYSKYRNFIYLFMLKEQAEER
jgi:glucosamine--fructose-6-phosphate aminotransferase (isomerizing)